MEEINRQMSVCIGHNGFFQRHFFMIINPFILKCWIRVVSSLSGGFHWIPLKPTITKCAKVKRSTSLVE